AFLSVRGFLPTIYSPPPLALLGLLGFTDKLKILTAKSRVRRDLERCFWNVTLSLNLSMLTSFFNSSVPDLFDLVGFGEGKNHGSFFEQIFPVIGKPSWVINL